MAFKILLVIPQPIINFLNRKRAEDDVDVDRVKQLFDKCKSEVSNITAKHKSIHAPISKMGKTIDKHFETSDFNPVGVPNVFDENNRSDLIKSVINHLNCSGLRYEVRTMHFYIG